jgi:hypothetical protein
LNNLNTADTLSDANAPSLSENSLSNKAKELKKMPMFHLMLGGRELFHSNFLAWLLGLDGDPFKLAALFGLEGVKLSVEREKLNLDLILSDGPLKKSVKRSSNKKIGRNGKKESSEPQCVVVIENKFKSLPDEEQLAKYEVKIERAYGRENKSLILLSFDKPSWAMEERLPRDRITNDFKWRWLSYKTLIKYLEDQQGLLKDNSDLEYLQYVEDYCKLVNKTDDFVRGVEKKDATEGRVFWFPSTNSNEQDQLASELKLQDMLQKRRAILLQVQIERAFKNSSLPQLQYLAEVSFASEHGFTRKAPLVGARLALKLKRGELRLGVQIQDKQYRRYIEWTPFHVKENEETKNPARLKNFIDETDKNEWLFGTDHDENGIMVQNGFSSSQSRFNTSMNRNNPYCSFARNFIYQYVNVDTPDKHAHLQSDNLPKSVIADLEYALKLLNTLDYRKRFESWKP